MKKNDLKAVPISLGTIEDFLSYLRRKKRSEATIRKYAADLKSFYKFLPEDKLLDSNSLKEWRNYLISQDFAARTVNTRIAACNSFLSYLKRKSWQVSPITLKKDCLSSTITREEYYKLLQTARESNNELLYFLIKTFCCLGLSVSELPFLTVKSLVDGKVTVVTKSRTKNVYIPEFLQKEFLDYANRYHINSGLLFKSPADEPLTRAYIVKELQVLCVEAGIPEEKGTPKSLCDLYYNTYSGIRSTSSFLVDKEYSKILEEENNAVGWDVPAV